MNIFKLILIVVLCPFICLALYISIGLLRVHQYHAAAKPEVYDGPEIHQAALAGDLDKVKLMLSQDATRINAQDKYGNVPIHLAAFKGHEDIVELLIGNGSDVNTKNKFGGAALYMASYAGHEQVVKILIAHGADINVAMKNDREQVLQVATMEGYKDYSQMWQHLGGSINLKVYFIGSPLQAAAANGYKTIAEILIANGAKVNAKVTGYTALHSAAVNGQKELVELMIAKGAEVNTKDKGGLTPLCSAMFWCREQVDSDSMRDVAKILIENGADVNVRTQGGFTPLHWAAGWASKETVQLLLSAGAEINAKSEEGDTPLNVACRYRRKMKGGVIDLLHKHGAVRRHGKNNSYEYEPDLIGMWP